MEKLLPFHAVNSLSHCLESQQQSMLSFQMSATFLASQKSLPIVTSLFLVSAVSSRCQLTMNYDEESLEGKTICKKNQALIKVCILNLREEKKYENRIVHGPQTEGENSKLNNITHQIRHWPPMVGGER